MKNFVNLTSTLKQGANVGDKMLKQFVVSALMMLTVIATASFAAETKVEGRIYSNWTLNTTDGADNYNNFDLGRSYVTVKSKLSDYTNVVITMDLRSIDGYKGYTMILKNGYAAWKPKFADNYLTFTLGLQPTKYLDAVDNLFWGRRYVLNSTGDLNNFLTTADLGVTINTDLGKKGAYGSAGLAILNGTKYSDVIEKNKQKDINPYLIFNPFPNNADFSKSVVAAQFYSGTQNIAFGDSLNAGDYKNQIASIGVELPYKKIFNVGCDLNWQTLGQGAGQDDLKKSALSGFGTIYLEPLVGASSYLRTLDLFGRVDKYDPNTNIDKDASTMIIAGVECVPVKGVAASINYRSTDFQADNVKTTSGIYFNSEFKF